MTKSHALPMLAEMKVAKRDKHGPLFKNSDVLELVAADINNGNHFTYKVKNQMTPDYENAAAMAVEAQALFERQHDAMLASMDKIKTAAKKASGGIRSAADDLRNGMVRIEKEANFNNLEKYVALLERAAVAMTSLAELEKHGRLDKIANALK